MFGWNVAQLKPISEMIWNLGHLIMTFQNMKFLMNFIENLNFFDFSRLDFYTLIN